MKSRLLHKIRLFLVAIIAISAQSAANGATHSVTATLDSAYLLMGKQTRLHLEIIEDNDNNGELKLPEGNITQNVEIHERLDADTNDLGNNRRQILQDVIIQSFDSGLYTISPIIYVSGDDTAKTLPLTLKVIPVDVDSVVEHLQNHAPIEDPDSRWWDILPDWVTDYWGWILLGLIIVIGIIVGLFLLSKKGRSMIAPSQKPTPPYDWAIANLIKLKEQHLWESGQEKEYYTQLTDILRDYLDRRFGINAMEMTSAQIIAHLALNKETKGAKDANSHMKEILQAADFVKFAKVRPLPDDNVKVYDYAMKFVRDTKPVPQQPSTKGQPQQGSNDNIKAENTTPKTDK